MALFLLIETEEAVDETVCGVKMEKLPNFFMLSRLLLVSTTSLAMRGLMWEVLVS